MQKRYVATLSLPLALAALPAWAQGNEAQTGPPSRARAGTTRGAAPGGPHAGARGFSDGAAFLRSPDDMFQLFPAGRVRIETRSSTRATSRRRTTPSRSSARGSSSRAGSPRRSSSRSMATSRPARPRARTPPPRRTWPRTDDFVGIPPRPGVTSPCCRWGSSTRPSRSRTAPRTSTSTSWSGRSHPRPRDPLEQGGGGDAARAAAEQGLLLLVRRVQRRRAELPERGRHLRRHGARLGRAVRRDRSRRAKAITLGGSGWTGKRKNALPLPTLSTAGGFSFWAPKWGTRELHQDGRLNAYAPELNAPIAHKGGLRVEYVHRHQQFGVLDTAKPSATALPRGRLNSSGGYALLTYWLVGDDRITGDQGMQIRRGSRSSG